MKASVLVILLCLACCLFLLFYVVVSSKGSPSVTTVTTVADLETLKRSLPKPHPQGNGATFSLQAGTNNEVIMIIQNDLAEAYFGNRLGRYLEAVSCCDLVGIHYLNTGITESSSFFDAFPSIVVHKSPIKDINYAQKAVAEQCPMLTSWPWDHAGAWNRRVSSISKIIAHAIDTSHPHAANHTIKPRSFSTIRTGSTIITAGESESDALTEVMLPLIPDAALVFRCVDLLTFIAPIPYGFINFNVYSHYIPADAKTIYVLSETMHYEGNVDHSARAESCVNMSLSLLQHLSEKFPSATVALRRGHALEHFIMVQKAPTVVCPPTTFCFFAAMAGSNNAYFQESALVNVRPFVRDNFYYIASPELMLFGDTLTNKIPADDPKALPEILERLRAPVPPEQFRLETFTPL
jgi:hypothetical protein